MFQVNIVGNRSLIRHPIVFWIPEAFSDLRHFVELQL